MLSASKIPISSSNCKSVFLREWWLIEVEKGTKLGIGGFVNRETLGSRVMQRLGSASVGKRYTSENRIQVFYSAAICKRLDENTLEAADGIIITISGSINRSRTLSYGFSSEICDRFLPGFPRNWEEYVDKSSREKHGERSLPISLDDLPVTRARDILMSSNGKSESCGFNSIIVRDILKLCNKKDDDDDDKEQLDASLLNPTQKIIEEDPVDLHDENPKEAEASFSDSKHEKITTKSKDDDDKEQHDASLLNQTQKIIEEAHKDPFSDPKSVSCEKITTKSHGGYLTRLRKRLKT